MGEIEPDTLLPSERMRQGAVDGEVTQVHRGQAYAGVGDTFSIDGVAFEVVDIEDRTLGDITDEDARAEGYQDVEQYREILHRAHENFEWDDDSEVVCHRFDRKE